MAEDVLTGTSETFDRFADTVAPNLLKALSNRSESQTLAQTRDLLLPKLLSGEIRLKDAERAVEAVA